MPDNRLELVAVSAAHPEPARIRSALEKLSLGEALRVTFGATPRFAAMLQTPRGAVTL